MFFEIIDFEHPAKWFEHEFFFLLKKILLSKKAQSTIVYYQIFTPHPKIYVSSKAFNTNLGYSLALQERARVRYLPRK